MPAGLQTTTIHAGQYQKLFNKKILPHAVQLLVMAEFGQKVPFPKEAGATQMRFTRGDVANAANVGSSGEGVPTTVFRSYDYTYIDTTLVQYDMAGKISDVLSWTNLFDTLKNMTSVMGEDVALHADGKIRDQLVADITGAGNRRYVGATQTFAGISGLNQSTGALTLIDVLDAMTRLTITRAPHKNGQYYLIVGPQVWRDILNDPKVLLAGQYGTSKSLVSGEVGKWYDVSVVKHTNPFLERSTADSPPGTEGVYSVATAPLHQIYRSWCLGDNAFGIPLMGGQSPFNPSIMICDRPDKSDPTNKFITVGLKTYWCVVTLNNQWAVSISSKSGYSG
jgi:N4-gp56 family major capsid protein